MALFSGTGPLFKYRAVGPERIISSAIKRSAIWGKRLLQTIFHPLQHHGKFLLKHPAKDGSEFANSNDDRGDASDQGPPRPPPIS